MLESWVPFRVLTATMYRTEADLCERLLTYMFHSWWCDKTNNMLYGTPLGEMAQLVEDVVMGGRSCATTEGNAQREQEAQASGDG